MKYILGACLLIAACVPADQMPMQVDAGKYPDYHALIADLVTKRVAGQPAPDGLRERLAQCWADDTVSMIQPADLDTLNAFARGTRNLTNSQLNEINDRIEAKRKAQGRGAQNLDRVVATCPQDIPEFKKYFNLDS